MIAPNQITHTKTMHPISRNNGSITSKNEQKWSSSRRHDRDVKTDVRGRLLMLAYSFIIMISTALRKFMNEKGVDYLLMSHSLTCYHTLMNSQYHQFITIPTKKNHLQLSVSKVLGRLKSSKLVTANIPFLSLAIFTIIVKVVEFYWLSCCGLIFNL